MEKLGASFLLGIGIQVFWMMIFNFIGIKISLLPVYVASFLSIGLSWTYTLMWRKVALSEAVWPYNPFKNKEWHKVNLPWLVLILFISYILWAITIKCLFWPTFEFDAVAGYDLVGKIVAAEGSFYNSLFMSNGVSLHNMSLRAVYPPLVSGSFAYAYMSGAETSKIISSLYYGSFIVLMYALFRRSELTHLGTAFGLLLIIFIPEMVSHAALSQTNMPQGVYTATGFMALYLWMINKEKNAHYLFLSIFIFACNSMVRSENIIFGFVAGLAVLLHTLKNRNKKNFINLLTFGLVVLLPFILWTVFLKIYGMKPAAPGEGLSLSLAYDAQKFTDWWGFLWGYKNYPDGLVMNQNFYALVPYLYVLFLFAAIVLAVIRYVMAADEQKKTLVKKAINKDLALLYISVAPFALYSIFYYFIDYDWDSIRNVMLFSFKRGLFGPMVLACCFIVLSEPLKLSFAAIGRFMYGKK